MMTTKPTTEFDWVFKDLEAPDYPATCDQCGLEGTNATIDSHICNEPLVPRAGERDTGEWYTDSKRSADATIYARKGNQWIGQVHARFADQIVTEHNQHATLVEQRERLIDAIRDVAIRSLLYCEQKYDHDDQARLNLEALLATIEQEGET